MAREIESGTAGGDGTQGPLTHLRLTAGAAELVWTSECMRGALPATAGGCARAAVLPCRRTGKPYRGAWRGPHMVDGTESGKSEYLERLDAEARARLTPEDWERAARMNSMPLEELDEIGEKADEERELQESFAEIP